MTDFRVKVIICVLMFLDHLERAILIPGTDAFWVAKVLQTIFAFSWLIFPWLIAKGFVYTRSVRKYATRMFIFAVLSQIPYSLAVDLPNVTRYILGYIRLKMYPELAQYLVLYLEKNILFTLFFGILALAIIKTNRKYLLKGLLIASVMIFAAVGTLLPLHFGNLEGIPILYILLGAAGLLVLIGLFTKRLSYHKFILVLMIAFAAQLLNFTFGIYGVLVIVLFYLNYPMSTVSTAETTEGPRVVTTRSIEYADFNDTFRAQAILHISMGILGVLGIFYQINHMEQYQTFWMQAKYPLMLLALAFIPKFNNLAMSKRTRHLFYWFYPAHLVVIFAFHFFYDQYSTLFFFQALHNFLDK